MSFKLDLPAPRVPMFEGDNTINPVWYRFFTGVSKRLGVSTEDLIESAQKEAEQAVAVAQQASELAAEAVQPGDNVSDLANDAGYLTSLLWGDIGGTLSNQTDLQAALNGKEDAFSKNTGFNKDFGTIAGTVVEGSQLANYQALSEKGQVNGYAELDGSGKVPAGQLPSYVDDVEEYTNFASFPVTGEAGKIYIDLAEADIYRWTGSAYAKINDAVSQADQALKWSSSITLTLGTDLTGNVSFDGSGNIVLNASVNNDSHNHTLSTITDAGTAAAQDIGYASGDVVERSGLGAIIMGASVSAPAALGETPVINDDDVFVFIIPKNTPSMLLVMLNNEAALITVRATSSAGTSYTGILSQFGTNIEVAANQVLTGTTGIDGKLNIAVDGANANQVYIENRIGATRVVSLQLFG